MTLIERRRILNLTDSIAPRDTLNERRLVVNFSENAALIVDERPVADGSADDYWSRTRRARLARSANDSWTIYAFGPAGDPVDYSAERAIGLTFATALEALSDDDTGIFWR